MDFWNRKKVRELEDALGRRDEKIESLRDQLRLAEKKIQGDRVCDGYCQRCAHSVTVDTREIWGPVKTYYCELDCKCKDFQRKGAEK